MAGYRGIFLDTLHPLISKRLDADTLAFKQMALFNKSTQGNFSNFDYTNTNEGYKYFSERKCWSRIVPFAIPATQYTTYPGYEFEGFDPNELVPDWREYVIWGTKSHTANLGDHYDYSPDFSHKFEKNWSNKKGLYRKTSAATWDEVGNNPISSGQGVINTPVPGITNLQVSNKGDLGTIRRASFDIKVHSIVDLENIEMMYMIPGMSVLIEWGWWHPKLYVDPIDVSLIQDGQQLASTTLINTEILKKTFGVDSPSNIGDPTPLYNLEEYSNKRFGPLGPPAGIYDGLLGVVTKFNWSNDGQGGYDCRVDVISPGSLAVGIPAESFNIGGSENIEGSEVPVTDLRTIVTVIKKETRVLETKITEEAQDVQFRKEYQAIDKVNNAETGNAKKSGDNAGEYEVTVRAMNTSKFGVTVSKDEQTGKLTWTKTTEDEEEGPKYYIGEFGGGKRYRAQKVYGDRTWWNRVTSFVTEKQSLAASFKGTLSPDGTKDTSKLFENKDYDGIKAELQEDRVEHLVNGQGATDTVAFAQMEQKYGKALRAGNFKVTKAPGWTKNKPWRVNLTIKTSTGWITKMNQFDVYDDFDCCKKFLQHKMIQYVQETLLKQLLL